MIKENAMKTSDRKEQHLRCCIERDVESGSATGFERYLLLNHPLPESTPESIDISSSFLGKKMEAPFIIAPITGGTERSREINKNLARAAQELGVAMGVGSQKAAIEAPSFAPTYQVREVAPDIPLLANLGAIYLNYGYGVEECKRAVDMIGADGLTLYLNPLQRVMQGSSQLNFNGLVGKISKICKGLNVPVIVKEVGFGLSSSAAVLLRDAGVWGLDVAGAGGTSWAKIERFIREQHNETNPYGENFDRWGIPTCESLVSIAEAVRGIPIIASGGIRNGVDMAKAIALGANYVGMALPLLGPALVSSDAVRGKIETVINEFRVALFCCGKKNLKELKDGPSIREIRK
jgi:isopentenyl-diphosphate Delta-isomerase